MSDDFSAILKARGKTILALAALVVGGASVNVVYNDGAPSDARIATCEGDLDAIKRELADLRAERPVQRLEPRGGAKLEVSSMAGAGRE